MRLRKTPSKGQKGITGEYRGYTEGYKSPWEAVMLGVICSKGDYVKIGSEEKSRNFVKSVYLKLNNSHIQHVIEQFKNQHHKITYKHAYIKTMLYNVYSEMELHYINQIRADGIVW